MCVKIWEGSCRGLYPGLCRATGGYLGGFGLTDAQGFSEVGVHGVVGLALSLGRLDPVGDHLDNREARE